LNFELKVFHPQNLLLSLIADFKRVLREKNKNDFLTHSDNIISGSEKYNSENNNSGVIHNFDTSNSNSNSNRNNNSINDDAVDGSGINNSVNDSSNGMSKDNFTFLGNEWLKLSEKYLHSLQVQHLISVLTFLYL
jgi:hypothetical protein